MRNDAILRGKYLIGALFLGLVGCCMLTAHAEPAHAFFTTDVCMARSYVAEAFPTSISVDAEGYKARGTEVDRDQLKVTATMSDGTTRELEKDEYDLSTSTIESGFKGTVDGEASLGDGDERLSATFQLNVDEAYGAQFGNVLVFGRGIPAESYGGQLLSNTTWGIEEYGCSPRWNKNALASVVDIDVVRPVDMGGWFNHSSTITSIVLDDMDTSNVTDMHELFYYDTAVKTLEVSRWNVSRVTSMQRMFSWCTALPSLNLSAWRTDSLFTAVLMFNHCISLVTPGNLGGWNVSTVAWMGNMFDYCAKLKTIGDVSGWDTSNVTNMEYMFAGCESIDVDCRNWNVSKVINHNQFNRDATWARAPQWP